MRLVNYVFPDGAEAPAIVVKEEDGRCDLLVIVYDNRFGAGQPLYLAIGIGKGGKDDRDMWREQHDETPKNVASEG